MNIIDCIKEWLTSFCDPVMYINSSDDNTKEMMNAFYDRSLNVSDKK